MVRERSLRRASVVSGGRDERPAQPGDSARCFCVSWLVNPSFAQTAAFPGKLSRPPSATFMRVATDGTARAHNHSTPAAPPPANSAGGSPLTSPLLSSPAVYQNPDAGVARPADVGLARKTGHGDRPESNDPAQRVEPRGYSRPSGRYSVFRFVAHGPCVGEACPGLLRASATAPVPCATNLNTE